MTPWSLAPFALLLLAPGSSLADDFLFSMQRYPLTTHAGETPLRRVWLTTWEAAQEQARKPRRLILAVLY